VTAVSTGDYIDNIHEQWWGDYRHLEWNHSYIQWLFPIRERGLNPHAQELQLHEAKVRSTETFVIVICGKSSLITYLKVSRKAGFK